MLYIPSNFVISKFINANLKYSIAFSTPFTLLVILEFSQIDLLSGSIASKWYSSGIELEKITSQSEKVSLFLRMTSLEWEVKA